MKYRILGDTGVLVSELCFGAMTFGGSLSVFLKTAVWLEFLDEPVPSAI